MAPGVECGSWPATRTEMKVSSACTYGCDVAEAAACKSAAVQIFTICALAGVSGHLLRDSLYDLAPKRTFDKKSSK